MDYDIFMHWTHSSCAGRYIIPIFKTFKETGDFMKHIVLYGAKVVYKMDFHA